MSMIYIADHQEDDILDFITEEEFWGDNHHKSLLDNQETFDFVTFADKSYSQYLEKMNRIIIQDEDGDWVELYIRNTRKYHDGDAVFTEVYTSATYVKLKTAKQIAPHRTEALTAEAHAIRALNGTEWTIGTVDFKGVRTFTFDDYVNPYDYLRRIASEFDLELRFRVETDGNKITKRYVDIVEYVGTWDGKEVEFQKDLIRIERKEDFSNVVTALIGLGPEDEEGNRLSVLVEDEEALQRWGRNGQHIIGIYEPESTDTSMTLERLTTLTENELEKRINSKIQYLANVVDLERVIGLEHEKLRFGDVIRIKDLKFNPPLYLEARVHTVDRSIKPRGHKTVTLGDFTEYTEEDVHAIVKDLRRQLRNKIGLGDLEELTYTKPEVDQKVADVVDDAQQAAVEVVDSIEIGGRNIASVDSVGTTGVTRDGYTYTIVKTGSSNPYMRIPTSRFEENKRYVISFKVKKISGNVTSIAGHDQSFRGMPVEIYRDGVKIEDVATWSVGDQNYPNDNEVYEYEIHLKTPETFPSDDSAPYWYIQPNRPNYGENYELELWNFQIEQATKKSNWERPQDDVEKDIKDAKDEAEEAKQTADNAQQSANGKNTVFYQPAEPSTEGRIEDDLWFDTSDGYKPHRFNGTEWEEAPFGHQAIASIDVGKVVVGRLDGEHIATKTIEAEHIKSLNGLVVGDNQFVVDENGNVSFQGRFEGPSGTFGEVSVNEGDITLKDTNSDVEYSLIPKTNLINDPSFELCDFDLSTWSTQYNWANYTTPTGRAPIWYRVGNPKITSFMLSGYQIPDISTFGEQSMVVNNTSYVTTYITPPSNSKVSLSAYFSRQHTISAGMPRFIVRHVDALYNPVSTITSRSFDTVPNDYSVFRYSLTFDVPALDNGDMIEIVITSANVNWVKVDGVQAVINDIPTLYSEEEALSRFLKGKTVAPSLYSDLLNVYGRADFWDSINTRGNVNISRGSRTASLLVNANNQLATSGLPLNVGVALYSYGVYSTTTSTSANVAVTSDYQLARSTSSIKYKKDVEDLWDDVAEKVLELRPIWYRDKEGNADAREDWSHLGFIAEEVHEIEPRLVQYRSPFKEIKDEEGNVIERIPLDHDELEPEGVKYERITVGLVSIVKRQKKQLEEQNKKITELEERLARLEDLKNAE